MQDAGAQLAAPLLDAAARHAGAGCLRGPRRQDRPPARAHAGPRRAGRRRYRCASASGCVRENLERLRRTARTAVRRSSAAPKSFWDGRPFDRILVDAPCSSTGVIRRHPDIKLLRRRSDIPHARRRAAGAARRSAATLLAPGGRLLYCTCSVLPAENEEVVGRLLGEAPRLRRRRDAARARLWPGGDRSGRTGCSCCRERRRGPTASIMLVSKRQRPDSERLPSQASMLRRDPTRTGLIPGTAAHGVRASRACRDCAGLRSACGRTRRRARGAFRVRERRQRRVPAARPRRVSRQSRDPGRVADGITLTFDLDTRVERERRFWFDAAIVDSDAATRAVVPRGQRALRRARRAQRGPDRAFATLEEALDASSARVDGWPILVEPQLDGGKLRRQRARGRAARQVARFAARAHVLDRRLGTRTSEWYTWSLPV